MEKIAILCMFTVIGMANKMMNIGGKVERHIRAVEGERVVELKSRFNGLRFVGTSRRRVLH